jgi:hypothetical protein
MTQGRTKAEDRITRSCSYCRYPFDASPGDFKCSNCGMTFSLDKDLKVWEESPPSSFYQIVGTSAVITVISILGIVIDAMATNEMEKLILIPLIIGSSFLGHYFWRGSIFWGKSLSIAGLSIACAAVMLLVLILNLADAITY